MSKVGNIGGKIDLTQLIHVTQMQKAKKGKEVEVLVIPIEANNLFKGKDGNIYMDIIAFELKEEKEWSTHLVKQSLSKDVRAKMSKDEINDMPILGNLKVGIGGEGAAPKSASGGDTLEASDDLPF